MLEIKVKTRGKKQVVDFIKNYPKQLAFATRLAVNETAKVIKKDEVKEMRRSLKQPKPFTVNALGIKFAKKGEKVAKVKFKDVGVAGDIVTRYMKNVIEGTAGRQLKGSESAMRRKGILDRGEYLVPSRTAPLDRYGNVRSSTINKIMANIGANSDKYANTPVQWTRERGRKREYIFGTVGRTKGVFQKQGDNWKMIFIVVKKKPKYAKKYDFYGAGHRSFNKNIDREFDKAYKQAMRTAR